MLALPGVTIPTDGVLRAAVRRIAGVAGAVVMIGPVVRRAPTLVATLDQPRDLYLCHDFGGDAGECCLTPMREGTRWPPDSPMALGDALGASGYPMSRIYWSREPMMPRGPAALVIVGRRVTVLSPAPPPLSYPCPVA